MIVGKPGQDGGMDEDRARTLLTAERSRVGDLLADTEERVTGDTEAAAEPGDQFDAAQPLNREGVDDAITASLRDRLDALDRADARLADGSYGVSIRSGEPIPDARLEHDPAAELTVTEQAADEQSGRGAKPADNIAP